MIDWRDLTDVELAVVVEAIDDGDFRHPWPPFTAEFDATADRLLAEGEVEWARRGLGPRERSFRRRLVLDPATGYWQVAPEDADLEKKRELEALAREAAERR